MSSIRHYMNIMEALQEIGDVDFHLPDSLENEQTRTKLMYDPNVQFLETWNGLKLYRTNRYFFAVDDDRTEHKLVYLIKIVVKQWSFINDTGVTQAALWRDLTDIKTQDLPQYVFFSYLLDEYHICVTDSQQSDKGQIFWGLRINKAFLNGLNVYFADTMSPRKLIKIENQSEFDKLRQAGEIWGPSQKFQSRKLIISDKVLTPRADVKN